MEAQINIKELLDPTNDIVFKYYFSKPKNKTILISFIESVIEPDSPIEDLEILNPTIDKDSINDKTSILDLIVELKDGSKIDVEMQVARTPRFRSRVLYYWSKLHQSQLKEGESYENIHPTISICVLGYNEFLDNENRLHSTFELREQKSYELYSSDLKLHFLELPKYKKWKQKNEHKNLDNWTRFFTLKKSSQSEIQDLNKEPLMDKAIKALEEVSQDARLKELLDHHEKNLVAYNLAMHGYIEEGKAQGIEQGIEQTRALLIKNASKNGMSPELISKTLEIPISLIEKVLKS